MIRISAPWKENIQGYTYAKVRLQIDAETCRKWEEYCNLPENEGFTKYLDEHYVEITSGETELWFAVEEKYGNYMCVDRGDAFVVMLLHYAMATGADIISEAPVSSMLLYNIRTEIIPHLCIGRFAAIQVQADAVPESYPTQHCGATGMSCGIDSFFSLWQHTLEGIPEDFKIKYLTFFNVGAINAVFADDISLERRNELMFQISLEKAKQALAVAEECNMELLFINSNISNYYRGMLVNSAHYRNCGTAMLMQGLWDKYYYSSGGLNPSETHFSLSDDPAYHEDMLLPWLSNGTIRFYSTGHGYPRIEKTRILADFPLAQKYLTVCDLDENCGKCNKCKRTIATLYVMDKLDNFNNRFDLQKVEKQKYKRDIFLKRKQRFYNDIYHKAEHSSLYSVKEKLLYFLMSIPYEILRNNKIYRKIRTKQYRSQIRNMK